MILNTSQNTRIEHEPNRFVYYVTVIGDVALIEPSLPELGADVIFVANGSSKDQCLAVCQAIVDVYNIWIRKKSGSGTTFPEHGVRSHGDWETEPGPADATHDYVYVYASPNQNNPTGHTSVQSDSDSLVDRVFYIGRGIGNRWISHIREVNAGNEGLNEISKQRLIQKGLRFFQPELYPQDMGCGLVRQIAWFAGEFRVEQADAVEKFLISSWAGVYKLANLTRGNSVVRNMGYACRPKSILPNSEVWWQVLNEIGRWSGALRLLTQQVMNRPGF